jgi:hypothetical protein
MNATVCFYFFSSATKHGKRKSKLYGDLGAGLRKGIGRPQGLAPNPKDDTLAVNK